VPIVDYYTGSDFWEAVRKVAKNMPKPCEELERDP
jgi:hypothetical protein